MSKLSVQYLTNSKGQTKAVQIPIEEWEKLLEQVNKYEQSLQLKNNLEEALHEAVTMKTQRKAKLNRISQ